MAGISISNPAAQGMDGVSFTGTRDGAQQAFLVAREALEDLEYTVFETPQAMLDAFSRHQQGVAEGAARAMDSAARAPDSAAPGGPAIVLQTLLF